MTNLYLAWHVPQRDGWFPVGRLSHHETDAAEYEFAYVRGALKATKTPWFIEIPGFPETDKTYKAHSVFSAFRDRVMNLRRPDRPEYLNALDIDADDWDVVSELSVSGGRASFDKYETFPEILPDPAGWFSTRFILPGLIHTGADSVERSESLEAGESLELAVELNEPSATPSIAVKTRDHYVLGWLPRFLIDGLCDDDAWMITEASARVRRVSLDVPHSHRLLIDFEGRLPAGFSPMRDLPQYQPIPKADGRRSDS